MKLQSLRKHLETDKTNIFFKFQNPWFLVKQDWRKMNASVLCPQVLLIIEPSLVIITQPCLKMVSGSQKNDLEKGFCSDKLKFGKANLFLENEVISNKQPTLQNFFFSLLFK